MVGDLKVLRRSEKALGRDFEKNNDKITGRYDGRFITRDKNNKKISKTWRTAFHLDFKDMDIHSTTTLLARNTIRQIYYYPGIYNTLFGQGYYDGKSKGKLTYNYYDGRFADDKVLLKLKVKEDKYNRLEHTKFTSKDPRFMGNFTITLSKSEISFEDWEGGKNHMTAKIINDLL